MADKRIVIYTLGVTVALAIVAASPLNARCPNACELTQTVSIQPTLSCLAIFSAADTCNCGVDVLLVNNCQAKINATGFTFPACAEVGNVDATLKKSCSSLNPNYRGELEIRAYESQGFGEHNVQFKLALDLDEYTLTVFYDIESFAPGCYCRNSSDICTFGTLFVLTLFIGMLRRR
jgi:hypothetical protein